MGCAPRCLHHRHSVGYPLRVHLSNAVVHQGPTGETRQAPYDRPGKICECSVNLVSPDFYRQHILPHDRRIAAPLKNRKEERGCGSRL